MGDQASDFEHCDRASEIQRRLPQDLPSRESLARLRQAASDIAIPKNERSGMWSEGAGYGVRARSVNVRAGSVGDYGIETLAVLS